MTTFFNSNSKFGSSWYLSAVSNHTLAVLMLDHQPVHYLHWSGSAYWNPTSLTAIIAVLAASMAACMIACVILCSADILWVCLIFLLFSLPCVRLLAICFSCHIVSLVLKDNNFTGSCYLCYLLHCLVWWLNLVRYVLVYIYIQIIMCTDGMALYMCPYMLLVTCAVTAVLYICGYFKVPDNYFIILLVFIFHNIMTITITSNASRLALYEHDLGATRPATPTTSRES